jgi:hypothetical protein
MAKCLRDANLWPLTKARAVARPLAARCVSAAAGGYQLHLGGLRETQRHALALARPLGFDLGLHPLDVFESEPDLVVGLVELPALLGAFSVGQATAASWVGVDRGLKYHEEMVPLELSRAARSPAWPAALGSSTSRTVRSPPAKPVRPPVDSWAR